ncbi:MAG: TetR/AcrR family transcriptional regulator [Xanthomonadales bacterium]|nr:TetR/AcrR family transcriptional regulator [Xanthomonadales bacterium]NNL94236.1 TetR/AcrR family transcriptional regulator [Xanthomonadales bacterium]
MSNLNKTERARGRPADMPSGELQENLLDAAEQLFAEKGFAATSIRELADAAGVNPALVHYYFGSKKKLLIAVMDRALMPIAKRIGELKESGGASAANFASLFFEMATVHPAMPKLVVREVMMSAGDMRELFVQKYAPRLGGALPGLLAREQRLGRINPALATPNAALMLLSLCVFPFIARPVAEPGMGIDYSEAGLVGYLEQVQLLLDKGMRP